MFISKFINAFGSVFLLSLIGLPFQKAEANILYHIGADFMPMLSLSWDKMMGLNIGIGASSGQDIYIGMTGPYIYTNFALKKNRCVRFSRSLWYHCRSNQYAKRRYIYDRSRSRFWRFLHRTGKFYDIFTIYRG